jgi:hypothetical protein
VNLHGNAVMQRRVRRNRLLFIAPVALFITCSALLVWGIARQNLPGSTIAHWPWKLQLLDIQSATTAVTITGGLILARAQYAATVRPMATWSGAVVKTSGYSSRLIWLVRLKNGCATPSYFRADGYRILFKSQASSDPEGKERDWITRDEAIHLLTTAGLKYRSDYDLNYFGPAVPLSLSNESSMLAIFTPKAMVMIDDFLILVRAKDLAGDTHERIVYCMLGAERNPKNPDHAP